MIRLLPLYLLLPSLAVAAPLSPLALSCQGCHRPSSGSDPSSNEFIALDRLSATAISASLRRFRDAPEAGTIMPRFAGKLSDDDIVRLAGQLSSPTQPR